MKRTLLALIGLTLMVITSCSREITVSDAANARGNKCGHYLK